MSFQRSYGRLQASPHWRTIEEFAKDKTRLELPFGTEISSSLREDIRQICKYIGVNFRCVGQGSQKRMVVLKFDAIRERERAEELAKQAKGPVAEFFRGVIDMLPEERVHITALFVKHYGGEKAWSLGEDEVRKGTHVDATGKASSKRRRTDGSQLVATADGVDEANAVAGEDGGSSDSEDAEALLGRWVAAAPAGND
eukprot:TRINITY_DN14541_c0_g1_i1.p1 TRINITY_DN14541_c0_g1~~TRINITY_DN14541_c0_g1_i1.p1  ORF type:complete len:198 (-),score=50.59 TRINITY_DN14541_c0_g1_i1:42-635(-)